MGEEFEKASRESLGSENGPIPTTIKLLAMRIDQQNTLQEKVNNQRHEELLKEIRTNREAQDELKKKLRIFIFIAEYPKLFYALVFAFFILIAHDAKNFWIYINK